MVSGQRSAVSGQWSAVSGQRSAVSGQRSAYVIQKLFGVAWTQANGSSSSGVAQASSL
ncbi:hypothetical protein [Moorena sp. SIOASIH]|uniref:hypothetical protein n=1 Tax=Moorena sp. SIOASIH TaxID=2607817 RepID=UPI0025DD3F7B|nr:hypothetical protein [Moorena sp. SIOASIH]